MAPPHILHRRDRVAAVVVSLFMHVLLGIGAFMMQMQDRTVQHRALLLELQPQAPKLPAEATRQSTSAENAPPSTARTDATVMPPKPTQSRTAQAEASDVLRGEQPVVRASGEVECVDSLPPVISTTSAHERMSQEEAFGELMRLLERHPEFKETILREMLAGDGAVTPPAKLEIFGLEQLLALHKGKLALPGAGSRSLGGVNPNPTYSPIHGTNPNPVAGSFNYIGLLLKLISLIKGD